jgi:predicted NodU family carbamoyl transferase
MSSGNVEEQQAAAMEATMEKPSEDPVVVNTSFSEEQEALVLSAWDAMKADSAAIALKFFLRYRVQYEYIHMC